MGRGRTEALDARIDEILLSRLTPICAATLLTIPPAFVYCVFIQPGLFAALFGGIGWLAAAVMLYLTRAGRMPPRAVAHLLLGLWLLILLAALSAFEAYRDPLWMTMALLVIVSQGAIQLRARGLVAQNVLGGALCVAFQYRVGVVNLQFCLAVLVATALAILVYLIGRAYVNELEQRREALTAALTTAQAALADRDRAEVEREGLRTQFVEAQRMEAVGTLASGLAHDFNNLLGGILSLAELAHAETTGRTRDDLDEIRAACRRGGEITQNLLAFTRRGQYQRERVALDEVATQVAALLHRTAPKRIAVTLELAGKLDVDGDATQLGQALMNICLNSIDAITGEGRLVIAARETGDEVALEVRDDGTGMDAETVRRVFEPFFTTKEPGKGTGLGLAMVYGTVQAHGGRVAVSSTPGAGTLVSMVFPRATLPASKPAEGASEAASDAPASGTRILVVDDEALIRAVLRRHLERRGYVVDVATNGAEAVELVRAGLRPGLIVLDMSMPVMDGATAFRAIRAIDPEARIVLASGYALQDDTRACLAAGALGFLHKPFTTKALLVAIETALRGERVEPLSDYG